MIRPPPAFVAPGAFTGFPEMQKEASLHYNDGDDRQTRDVDTYSVADAAKLLQVSPKRVRQLVEEGRLSSVEGSSPLVLEAESVIRERKRREEAPSRPGPAPAVTNLDPSEILAMASEIASSVARDSVRLALESAEPARRHADAMRDRTEEALREALAAAEARSLSAEKRLEEALERLEGIKAHLEETRAEALQVASAVEPRRRWGRKKGG